jgi:capsular exopolysaccharide synthesis family protein
MGIIAEALKKASEETGTSGPVVDVPSFGGLLSAGPDRQRVTGVQRARMILENTPGLDERVVVVHESDGVLAEQYRSLRTRLLNQNPDNEHRVLAVTSSLPQEGKSVSTMNLSFVLSEVTHLRILMVDGDFRRGRLASMLNVEVETGLSDVIRGQATVEDAIHPTAAPNLFFMGVGNTGQANATEILSSARARSTLDMLRKRFHYVIVDTPPINTVADVGIIGQMCHGVLLIIRMHHTTEYMAKRALKLLQANKVNVLGCVLVGRYGEVGAYGYYAQHYYRYYHGAGGNK